MLLTLLTLNQLHVRTVKNYCPTCSSETCSYVNERDLQGLPIRQADVRGFVSVNTVTPASKTSEGIKQE